MLHRDHTAPTALSLSSATNELQPFPVTNDVTCSQWLVKESSVSADRARCSLCMQHIGIVFADEWKLLSCVAKVTFNQMADELYMCIGSDFFFFLPHLPFLYSIISLTHLLVMMSLLALRSQAFILHLHLEALNRCLSDVLTSELYSDCSEHVQACRLRLVRVNFYM